MVFRSKREIAKKTHGKKKNFWGGDFQTKDEVQKRLLQREKVKKKKQDDMTFMIKIEGPIQSTDMASIGMRKR